MVLLLGGVNNMKKKKYIIILLVVLILILTIIILLNNKSNLIKLSYNEVIEKINNKEDFILCITATNCTHCQEYKPKLKKISSEYNIKIYYTDINTFNDEDYENFKTKLSLDGSTPITIFIKDGTETTTATRIEGNVSTEKIIKKLKSNGFIK